MSRGIATLAGGTKYFLLAYANCKLLRSYGCELPIEWFYLGPEMSASMLELAEEIEGVQCIDLLPDNIRSINPKGARQTKAFAMIEASFDETLFIDADSFPLVPPDQLFDFLGNDAAIFWPSNKRWSSEKIVELNNFFEVKFDSMRIDSGQMLFRRDIALVALELAKVYNMGWETVYGLTESEHDTFLIAFRKTKIPHTVLPKKPEVSKIGSTQFDPEGRPAFFHMREPKHLPPLDLELLKKTLDIGDIPCKFCEKWPPIALQT